MSQEERKVADTRGRFARAVVDGRTRNDVAWTNGRIILSNRRLVLVGNEGQRTLPLSKVEMTDGRHDASQDLARVSGYIGVRYENDVFLVAAEDHVEFEMDFYRAFLDQAVVLAKHPAVEGGVVTDATWEQARMKVDDEGVSLALRSGTFVEITLDDVGRVETSERTVKEDKRYVLAAEHSEGQTSVETHLAGQDRRVRILESLLRKGVEQNTADIELDETEREVLMALYSGVSPFDVPEFVGEDVDDVEEIYERLVELDVLDEVRVRREVTLKSRGRNIASEAMNDN
ncbi:MAG: CheF family chemotaxis protein [Halarchaeum sp.]